MQLRNHILFLLIFVLTCALLYCKGQQVQVKKDINCSALLEEAKKELLEGKEAIQTTKNAKFEFSNNHQCISEDKVIFGMDVYIKHYDMGVREFICANLFMEIIAERKEDKINFEFGEAEIRSMEICGGGLGKGIFGL